MFDCNPATTPIQTNIKLEKNVDFSGISVADSHETNPLETQREH